MRHRWPGAVELLDALRRRQLSAREVVVAHIERISAVDAALNAVVLRRFDEALGEAAAVDAARVRSRPLGPLAGLPVTVKECYDVRGMASTAGVARLGRAEPGEDAPVVARLRRAGAIVLGKTNLAQLSWALETENPLYGLTRNPWDLDRTPGGSSGGEAAIVAAGGSPLGLGTDSGGSVRIPAHFCGLHGLKPTSRRLSDSGTVDSLTFSFQSVVANQPGLLARSTADLRLGYSVLTSRRPLTVARHDNADSGPCHGLRVGYYLSDGTSRPLPAIIGAVLQAARALEDSGAMVVEFEPPRVAEALEVFEAAFRLDAGRLARRLLADGPRDWRMERVLEAMPPAPLDERGVERLCRRARGVRRRFAAGLAAAELDAVIAPPAPVPALPHGVLSELSEAGNFCALYNLLGWPSGVTPVCMSRVDAAGRTTTQAGATPIRASSLPIGVQVAVRPWQEDLLLGLMEHLEGVLSEKDGYPSDPAL